MLGEPVKTRRIISQKGRKVGGKAMFIFSVVLGTIPEVF